MRFRAALAAAVAIVCIGVGAAAADPTTWSGTVRVIDGDTISVRQQRIRIAAIDACERPDRLSQWQGLAMWH